MNKDALNELFSVINKEVDLSLDAELELEKQALSSLCGTEDQNEGMNAIIENAN